MFKVKDRIVSAFEKFNITTVGITDASLYNAALVTSFKSIIVALFPYYCGEKENSNISMYTYGKDYHQVIRKILENVCNELNFSDFAIHSDIGPDIERKLATDAGLCFLGKNGLCINDEYGSYFFIGYIACAYYYADTDGSFFCKIYALFHVEYRIAGWSARSHTRQIIPAKTFVVHRKSYFCF